MNAIEAHSTPRRRSRSRARGRGANISLLLTVLLAGSVLFPATASAAGPEPEHICGHIVQGRILEKYREYRDTLGCPRTGELTAPDGVGRFHHFERGSIYWSPSTDAHAVWGLIGDKWAAMGWEKGSLGYPTSDELPLPDGAGKRQVFQGGSLYWHPTRSNGVHPVWGLIGQRWGQAGWEGGVYGYPVTDELQQEGVTQMFEHGPIRWSPNETPNPLIPRAKAKLFDGRPTPGDLNESATLLPKGPDRGIVVVRGYIGDDGNPVNHSIGNHRLWSTEPEASSKVVFAWDTATGQVGVYVERSCVGDLPCRNAKPLVRTQHAKVVQDDRAPQNEYWVEPYGDGGLRVDVSAVNSFADVPGSSLADLGRINATFFVYPHGYDGNNRNFTGFDVQAVKDRFPSWEVLRYPRLLERPDAPQALWQGAVWQTGVGDLTAPQHSCHRTDPDHAPGNMTCN
ncbi:LGFP repeat-containing protein [Streptomyces sp. cmx-4-9]|uniref:LGFP repeat-containing protein n=1 Tax=Streptomyces sp. cmx-4-9 TaxID=2790941 RepID=UPI003980471C